MTRKHVALAFAAAAGVTGLASEAAAQVRATVYGPAPGRYEYEGGEGFNRAGFSLAGNLGFTAGNDGYSGFAVGFRAGYTFPFHLYFGGDLTFYPVNGTTFVGIAPELGFDIGLRRVPLVIRPYFGLGFVDLTANGHGALEFYPGAEVLYYVTRSFFVGGDVRLPFIFEGGTTDAGFAFGGGTVVGLNVFGTIGYKF